MRTAVLLAALAALGCGKRDRDREAPAAPDEPAPPPAARTTPRPAPQPPTDARVDLIARCWAGVDSGGPARACFAIDALPPRASFPDLQHKLGTILVAGDQAVVTFVAEGTNRAAFRGRPPSYHAIGLLGAQHLRLERGKITGSTLYLHAQSLLGQLGMLPPAASYRAVASGPGQTRALVARDDDAEKANLAAVTALEATLAAGKIDEAVAAFAPGGRFLYVPGGADATGPEAVKQQLALWRKREPAAPAAAWTLAAGDQVAAGNDAELHLYRLAGGKVAELWIYAAATAQPAPAPRPPGP